MTRTMRIALTATTILSAGSLAGLAAQAGTLAALSGDNTLTMIDTATMKAGCREVLASTERMIHAAPVSGQETATVRDAELEPRMRLEHASEDQVSQCDR